jgi:SAM-dependent methyltransferase
MADAQRMPRLRIPKNKIAVFILKVLRRAMVKIQYYYINRLDRNDHQIALMNYGYVPLEPEEPAPELADVEEKDRCALQLYHAVAGAVDLAGKDVLEIGSGRGGGAAYIATRLGPRSVTAVDLCKSSVMYCRLRYNVANLSFVQGDAEALTFPDASFDAVINIESSHCYNRPEAFVAGVFRVLRRGGYFLHADFRIERGLEAFGELMRETGFEIIEDVSINANVFAALERESDRKRDYILAKVPPNRQPQFFMFAAVKGTDIYEGMRSGSVQYGRFVARKPLAAD